MNSVVSNIVRLRAGRLIYRGYAASQRTGRPGGGSEMKSCIRTAMRYFVPFPSDISCVAQRGVIGRGVMSIIPVRTLWRMTWQDRLTLGEAIVWLAIAGLIIAVVPFRNFGFLAALPVRKLPPADEARNLMRRQIRWAIVTAARRVPWRALCIQQGLAAQFMLRRRGIPSVLYYGAALREGDLKAHVWVRDGNIDVIGGEAASRYALLARFPA